MDGSFPIPLDFFTSSLSASDAHRYGRQILLNEIGPVAQSRIGSSSALVIGCGGLGSTILMFLASCGLKRLGFIDHDTVELNNLHRQIVHKECSVGRTKVDSAAETLKQLNSTVVLEPYLDKFSTQNALALACQYDIIVDASDNAATRCTFVIFAFSEFRFN